jgi:hypothetical protein
MGKATAIAEQRRQRELEYRKFLLGAQRIRGRFDVLDGLMGGLRGDWMRNWRMRMVMMVLMRQRNRF